MSRVACQLIRLGDLLERHQPLSYPVDLGHAPPGLIPVVAVGEVEGLMPLGRAHGHQLVPVVNGEVRGASRAAQSVRFLGVVSPMMVVTPGTLTSST